jgi:hypothetical protein
MAKPTLFIPSRLHVEVFQQVVLGPATGQGSEEYEKTGKIPISHHPREPLEIGVWFSVRPAVIAPVGTIVDGVVPPETKRAVCIRQEKANPGVLMCDTYDVKILDLFDNCDILARGALFLSECITAFKIKPAKFNKHGRPSNDNLRPTKELLQVWGAQEKSVLWPSVKQLRAQGCGPEIVGLFQKQKKAIKAKTIVGVEKRDANLPFFRELLWEFLYHENTTNQILRMARPLRCLGPDLSDRDLVERVKWQLALTSFTNGARWTSECSQSNIRTNNWGGFVISKKSLRKIIIRVIRGGRDPDSPWLKAGPALVKALEEALLLPANSNLEDAIVNAFNTGHLSGAANKIDIVYAHYCKAKMVYVEDRFWKVENAMTGHMGSRPTAEEIRRALMGFMRAVDRKVVDRTLDFDKVLQEAIRRQFGDEVDWQARHPGDQWALGEVMSRVDPRTGRLIPRMVALADDAGPEDPEADDEEELDL